MTQFLLELPLSTLMPMSGFQARRNGEPTINFLEFWVSSPIHLIIFTFQSLQIDDPCILSKGDSCFCPGRSVPALSDLGVGAWLMSLSTNFTFCDSNNPCLVSEKKNLTKFFYRHYLICLSYAIHYSTTFTKKKRKRKRKRNSEKQPIATQLTCSRRDSNLYLQILSQAF